MKECFSCLTDALSLAHGGSAGVILARLHNDLAAQPVLVQREYTNNQTNASLASLGSIGINTCENAAFCGTLYALGAQPWLLGSSVAVGSILTVVNHVRNIRTIDDKYGTWQREHRNLRAVQHGVQV